MIHEFFQTQKLPLSQDRAWEFLSDPRNLCRITPPHMKFVIQSSEIPPEMYSGMIVTYRLYPFPAIPVNWVTEITHVEEPRYFVDEQRFGPYAFWHHQHFIEEIPGGVLMRDLIHYKVPGGPLGRIVEPFLVRPQLKKIFAFRRSRLEEFFGVYAESGEDSGKG